MQQAIYNKSKYNILDIFKYVVKQAGYIWNIVLVQSK